MYNQIKKHLKSLPITYCEKLIATNLVKADSYNSIRAKVFEHLDEEHEKAKTQR